jgi:molecular chaperone GrpE
MGKLENSNKNELRKNTIENNIKDNDDDVKDDKVSIKIEDTKEQDSQSEMKKRKKIDIELEKIKKERDEYKDKYIRKLAEFDNYRKRIEKERKEYYCYPTTDVIKLLLPVIDSFECAINLECKLEESHIKEGMELIYKQMMDTLQSLGLEPISALGEQFDPNIHQAVAREDTTEYKNNEVIEEMQKGYIFRDKLLRPAIVKVAIHSEEQENQEESDKTKENTNDIK